MKTPRYLANFTCLADRCPETCCGGWNITVDKWTYKKYRQLQNHPLGAKLRESVKKVAQATDANFALVKLDEGGQCGLLDGGLCSIHAQLGPQYLSDTCRYYPRSYTEQGDELVMHGTLSCPETARLALQDPDAMELVEVPDPNRPALARVLGLRIPKKQMADGGIYAHIPRLRLFVDGLLRRRDYRLWERLVILGLFVRAIAETETSAAADALIDQYSQLVDGRAYDEVLRDMKVDVNAQVELFRHINVLRFSSGKTTRRFAENADLALQGLGGGGSELATMVGRFREAKEAWYGPLMAANPHFLENYLLNVFHRRAFGFDRGQYLYQRYCEIVINYAMVRNYMIGLAAFHKAGFDIDLATTLVQSYNRNIEHNAGFIGAIYGLFKVNGQFDFSSILLLVAD